MRRAAIVVLILWLTCSFVFGQEITIEQRRDLVKSLDILNVKYDQSHIVFSPDGRTIYFTIANHPSNIGGRGDKGDIWYSVLDENNQWSRPINIGTPLNTASHDAVLGFSSDGNIMFLLHHYLDNGQKYVNRGISYSVLKNGRWETPKVIPVQYFKNTSHHISGCISADGNIMLLSMASYVHFGTEDIYVSFFDEDKWGELQNLGSIINTRLQETTPFLAPDNKTLFFSSNGQDRDKKGRNIFVTERLDDTWKNWSIPRPVGEYVNTMGSEWYYVVQPQTNIGYYVSVQSSNGYGNIKIDFREDSIQQETTKNEDFSQLLKEGDIEEVFDENENRVLAGFFIDKINNKKLSGTIEIRGDNSNYFKAIKIDDSEKGFTTNIPNQMSMLHVEISVKGYAPMEEDVFLPNNKEWKLHRNFMMIPLKAGNVIELDRIYFHRATDNLIETSFRQLDKMVNLLKEYPSIKVELAGHTDGYGLPQKNKILSLKRARKVKNYLVSRGINDQRIEVKGYGGTKPVASNDTEETRRLNRRVEFIILEGL